MDHHMLGNHYVFNELVHLPTEEWHQLLTEHPYSLLPPNDPWGAVCAENHQLRLGKQI